MAEFDESKVINALHPEKAEVGKKYWFADSIVFLKNSVESDLNNIFVLGSISDGNYPFVEEGSNNSRQFLQFLYPYEEPPKKKMTYRMLSEWCAKGNGEYTHRGYDNSYTEFSYNQKLENEEVIEGDLIRPWDSEEWIEPTVDIYERDCKGGKEC